MELPDKVQDSCTAIYTAEYCFVQDLFSYLSYKYGITHNLLPPFAEQLQLSQASEFTEDIGKTVMLFCYVFRTLFRENFEERFSDQEQFRRNFGKYIYEYGLIPRETFLFHYFPIFLTKLAFASELGLFCYKMGLLDLFRSAPVRFSTFFEITKYEFHKRGGWVYLRWWAEKYTREYDSFKTIIESEHPLKDVVPISVAVDTIWHDTRIEDRRNKIRLDPSRETSTSELTKTIYSLGATLSATNLDARTPWWRKRSNTCNTSHCSSEEIVHWRLKEFRESFEKMQRTSRPEELVLRAMFFEIGEEFYSLTCVGLPTDSENTLPESRNDDPEADSRLYKGASQGKPSVRKAYSDGDTTFNFAPKFQCHRYYIPRLKWFISVYVKNKMHDHLPLEDRHCASTRTSRNRSRFPRKLAAFNGRSHRRSSRCRQQISSSAVTIKSESVPVIAKCFEKSRDSEFSSALNAEVEQLAVGADIGFLFARRRSSTPKFIESSALRAQSERLPSESVQSQSIGEEVSKDSLELPGEITQALLDSLYLEMAKKDFPETALNTIKSGKSKKGQKKKMIMASQLPTTTLETSISIICNAQIDVNGIKRTNEIAKPANEHFKTNEIVQKIPVKTRAVKQKTPATLEKIQVKKQKASAIPGKVQVEKQKVSTTTEKVLVEKQKASAAPERQNKTKKRKGKEQLKTPSKSMDGWDLVEHYITENELKRKQNARKFIGGAMKIILHPYILLLCTVTLGISCFLYMHFSHILLYTF